ncbi:MAG: prepilin-type N-terminal cleavage/methylation domain-containing protein [Verrucomicrobiae bacterium]|nr:prepilin-type N-terminal cleavage/methylation domain-containing protein [Verrucomicrobiae bacterium]
MKTCLSEKFQRPIKTGFTLVELLITLAILAVLFSLLLTSISKAKDKARQIVCMNNLRQIGTALNIYATDNDGRLPNLWAADWLQCFWPQVGPLLGEPMTVLADKYKTRIYKCPAEKYVGTVLGQGPVYALNYKLKDASRSNASLYAGCALSEISNPGNTLLVGDAFFMASWSNSSSQISTVNESQAGIGYRHSGGANLLFVDGHAAWQEKPAPSGIITK